MRRPALVPVVLLALVGAVLAGCGSSGSSASGASSAETTAGSGPVETTVPAPAGARPWFLKDGKVAPVAARPSDNPDPVRGALDALMAGPTPEEAAAGYSTGIAAGIVEVQSFEMGPDGIVTVSFSRKFETADTRPQTAQVVYTLTELPQVTKVRFLIDGQPNGATGVPPVGRADLRFPAAT